MQSTLHCLFERSGLFTYIYKVFLNFLKSLASISKEIGFSELADFVEMVWLQQSGQIRRKGNHPSLTWPVENPRRASTVIYNSVFEVEHSMTA